MVISVDEPTAKTPPHMGMDKGDDDEVVRQTLAEWGSIAHIRRRGEEAQERRTIPGYRARRWVVERTHSWMNRFRRLLIRWEKQADNHLTFVHFVCAWITWRAVDSCG